MEIENRRAVLAGVNGYEDSSIRSLAYSVADVGAVYDVLIDLKRGGFDRNNVQLLDDGSEDLYRPTRSNLMSAVKSLSETASGKDAILFFFSGHGIAQENKSYLLRADARINVLNETALPIDWIKRQIVESNARAKILIFDACHAGALIGKGESGKMTEEFSKSIFPAPEGVAILASCKINQVSYEWPEKGHGVFTYYLAEGLSGAADLNLDGVITVSEANRYVSDKVVSWAFGKGCQQNPTLEYRVSGDIVLARVPQPIVESMTTISKEKKPKAFVERVRLRPYYAILDRKKVCATLLSYYPPSQISRDADRSIVSPDADRSIVFPDGKLDNNGIDLFYKPENWDLLDEIIRKLGIDFSWNSVTYEINAKFDLDELVKLCRKSNMKIVRWEPQERLQMDVEAEGWGRGGRSALVSFENIENNGSRLEITQFKISIDSKGVTKLVRQLEDEFYDKLNPENIMTFLKPCLTNLTTEEYEKYKERVWKK